MSNDYFNKGSSDYRPITTEQSPSYDEHSPVYYEQSQNVGQTYQNLPLGQQSYSGQQYPYGAPEVTNPYGMNPYGIPEHPNAGLILGLGIAGIFVSIFSFVAWFMGAQARREIEIQHNYYWGGNLKTGYYLGKIMSIIQIVCMVLLVVLLFAGIFALPYTSSSIINVWGH